MARPLLDNDGAGRFGNLGQSAVKIKKEAVCAYVAQYRQNSHGQNSEGFGLLETSASDLQAKLSIQQKGIFKGSGFTNRLGLTLRAICLNISH